MTITNRDPKTGKILPGGKVLSSEEARELGSTPRGKKEKQASADQLLQEAGYDNPNAAPERKKLMAQEAAKGVVPAIKSFQTRDEVITVEPGGYPAPGERCPTCNQYVLADMQVSDDELDRMTWELDLDDFDHDSPEGMQAEVDRLTKLIENCQPQADSKQEEQIH